MSFAKVAVPIPLYPCDKTLDYIVPPALFEDLCVGQLVEVPFRSKTSWGIVTNIKAESDVDRSKLKAIKKIVFKKPVFDEDRLNFINFLSRHYVHPIGEVFECAIPGPVREASDAIIKKETLQPPDTTASDIRVSQHTLNAEQNHIVDGILKSKPGTHVIWGITGSGKTEVYLSLIEDTVRRGKNALVLVPEISLTPQLTSRFEERFPGLMAVFHSGQKPTALRRAWFETFWGNKRIALGARSALFAPIQNLGLIVVDEEHDASYKQEDRLRYHARDAAVFLGSLLHVPVVLGSATPSLESFHAVKTGKASLWNLKTRAVGRSRLPTIELVDLKKQIAKQNPNPESLAQAEQESKIDDFVSPDKTDFFFSPELLAAIGKNLDEKKQSILFLNRRGVGSHLSCPKCGTSPHCPSCDVALTPHKKNLLCHYCGFECPKLSSCKSCGQKDLGFVEVGIGTEAIEETLYKHFPQCRTLRMDRDSVASSYDFEMLVDKFKSGAADILVGTQMVAKGHDFPNVTLVGVILADLGMNVPDFRAVERSFQLLLQVSGRAGRAEHPGRVIVQTFQPEHPVLEALSKYSSLEDYSQFLEHEENKREAFLYPPTTRLALLRFEGTDLEKISVAASETAQALKRAGQNHYQVLGPVPSPLAKLRSKYRFQILIKSKNPAVLQKSLNWIMSGWTESRLEKKYHCRLVIDVDPYSML